MGCSPSHLRYWYWIFMCKGLAAGNALVPTTACTVSIVSCLHYRSVTILIVWMQHHRMFTYLRRTNNVLFVLNRFLLLGVTIVPFSTALLAENLQRSAPDRLTAILVYLCTYILLGSSFILLWWYASYKL